MASPNDTPVPEPGDSRWDSLDADLFVVTEANSITDTTVRPLRDSLRIRLGLPPVHSPPCDPPPPELPPEKPAS